MACAGVPESAEQGLEEKNGPHTVRREAASGEGKLPEHWVPFSSRQQLGQNRDASPVTELLSDCSKIRHLPLPLSAK